jgi:hypothetical protein
LFNPEFTKIASALDRAIEMGGDIDVAVLEFSFNGGEEIIEFIIDLIICPESSFPVLKSRSKAEFILCGCNNLGSFAGVAEWLKRKTL